MELGLKSSLHRLLNRNNVPHGEGAEAGAGAGAASWKPRARASQKAGLRRLPSGRHSPGTLRTAPEDVFFAV